MNSLPKPNFNNRKRLTESQDGRTCPNCSNTMEVYDFKYTCQQCGDDDVDYRRVPVDAPPELYYEVRAGNLYLRAPASANVSVYMSSSPLRSSPSKKRERDEPVDNEHLPQMPLPGYLQSHHDMGSPIGYAPQSPHASSQSDKSPPGTPVKPKRERDGNAPAERDAKRKLFDDLA